MLSVFQNKKVLVTGHTGFKGAWMIQVLHHLGAQLTGYALAPRPGDLYTHIQGDRLCNSIIADINDTGRLEKVIMETQPDFIFHLAAQSLVKEGYADPVYTYTTNVMGTVHLLNTLRKLDQRCVAVMITTDKVYENPETGVPFKEDDKLGGYDPYSSSKACDEILIHSFRRSYFSQEEYDRHLKSISSARAGNVIGGGDRAADRIIPDIVRAIEENQPVRLRNPKAVRPWQHVLEPVYAYLCLAQKMHEEPLSYNQAYNIGPEAGDMLQVAEVTEQFIQAFGKGTYEITGNQHHQHEAGLLLLDNTKIKNEVGFTPVLNAGQAISWTADWYTDGQTPAARKCLKQIEKYLNLQAQTQ